MCKCCTHHPRDLPKTIIYSLLTDKTYGTTHVFLWICVTLLIMLSLAGRQEGHQRPCIMWIPNCSGEEGEPLLWQVHISVRRCRLFPSNQLTPLGAPFPSKCVVDVQTLWINSIVQFLRKLLLRNSEPLIYQLQKRDKTWSAGKWQK